MVRYGLVLEKSQNNSKDWHFPSEVEVHGTLCSHNWDDNLVDTDLTKGRENEI